MWLSVICFVSGGAVAGYGALQVVGRADQKQEVNCWQIQEFKKKTYKVNQCTGMFEPIRLDTTTPNKPLEPTR